MALNSHKNKRLHFPQLSKSSRAISDLEKNKSQTTRSKTHTVSSNGKSCPRSQGQTVSFAKNSESEPYILPKRSGFSANKPLKSILKTPKVQHQYFAEEGYNEPEENANSASRLVYQNDSGTNGVKFEAHSDIVRHLKKHQIEANKFMWKCVIKSLDIVADSPGSGCILAHFMGLGKTLSVITFLHTLISNQSRSTIKTALVLCPVNVQLNWMDELKKWQPVNGNIDCFSFASSLTALERLQLLRKWFEEGGILVMSFHMYRNLLGDAREVDATLVATLSNPGPDMVVIDEGHVLKSPATQLYKTVNKIRTKRRIVLTGTPLQNNLLEYHCMVSFVNPKLLGSIEKFHNRFVVPIRRGESKDATKAEVLAMKKRISVLTQMLRNYMHRCDWKLLEQELPPKLEYTLFLRSTPIQCQLYNNYLEKLSRDASDRQLLRDYAKLRSVCSHPYLLQRQSDNKEDHDDTTWFSSVFSVNKEMDMLKLSTKFIVVIYLLRMFEKFGEKTMVFTQSVQLLNLLETVLEKEAAWRRRNASNLAPSWNKGIDYFRIDGSVRVSDRRKMINSFNNPENPRGRLILLSTRAGGLGINLIGASRCVILDPSWNPADDVHALFRGYRFGQTKRFYAYRMVMSGTMENGIYNRQVTKQALASRVVDSQQIERHFTREEIDSLYTFDANENGLISYRSKDEAPPFDIPNEDVTLACFFNHHFHLIKNFVKHNSLLDHQPDEELDEDEREAAWEDFKKFENDYIGSIC